MIEATLKEVPTTIEVIDTCKIVCDVCYKEIEPGGIIYIVETGHNDWGRDSMYSITNKDICSSECLDSEFRIYLKRSERFNNRNTEYMKINKQYLTDAYITERVRDENEYY